MAYPPAGTDQFTATALMTVELPDGTGDTFTLTGEATIERGDAFDSGNGRMEVPMSISALRMQGTNAVIGEITMVEEPVGVSGFVRQLEPGEDYPAESCTKPHHAALTAFGRLINRDDFLMRATIHAIPPYGETYLLDEGPIELVPEGDRVAEALARITRVEFTVVAPVTGG